MKFSNLSLKQKLISGFLFLLVFVCVGFGVLVNIATTRIVLNQIRANIPNSAKAAADLVKSQLDCHVLAIESISNRTWIRSEDWEQQKQAMEEDIERYGYLGMAVIKSDGTAYYPDGTTAALGDREYFKQAMRGETVFSSVIISRVINKPVLMIATPIYDFNNRVTSVLIARLDATLLSSITDNLGYGERGYAYMIDEKGTLIAHSNRDFVLDQRNFIEESKSDNQYLRLA